MRVPASGFRYGGALEMYLAALEWRIPPHQWDRLDPEYQALMIAVYRCRNQMAAITDHYIVNRPR